MIILESRDTCNHLKECRDKISFILKSSVEAAGARVIDRERGSTESCNSCTCQGKLVIRFRRASECADRRRRNARLRHSYSLV
jgi:hypothetical protein